MRLTPVDADTGKIGQWQTQPVSVIFFKPKISNRRVTSQSLQEQQVYTPKQRSIKSKGWVKKKP